jgi:hypothetical protein
VFEEDGHDFDLQDNHNMNRRHSLRQKDSERMEHDRQNITAKARLLNEMNNTENHYSNAGMMIDASAIELNTTHGALYAETISNVCIIFTDIVGFSQVALDMNPIKVMDMLQDLFSRFDALCDKHGIRKLETIGDAYIATTDMFTEESGKRYGRRGEAGTDTKEKPITATGDPRGNTHRRSHSRCTRRAASQIHSIWNSSER